MGAMTTRPPQHHASDRVQRLEAWAFGVGADLADIKARLDELPSQVRQEILEYTEPVFGEIMAGRATMATKQDLDAVEQRLGGKIDALAARFDRLLAALDKGEQG
jgi:hypothetical protein